MYYDTFKVFRFGMRKVKLPQGRAGLIGTCWSNGNFYEQGLLKKARSLKRRGQYVDVGMNCGNHSLFFAKLCKSTMVLSFEPYPIHIDRANELFRENGVLDKVRTFNCALGEGPGMLELSIREQEIKAPQMRLDDLALNNVAVIKIDVEGAESAVLKGAEETIRRCKPHIFIEIFDETLDETTAYIEAWGYKRGEKFKTPTYEFIPV